MISFDDYARHDAEPSQGENKMTIDQEKIQLFLMAYDEGFQASKIRNFVGRKTWAMQYAREVTPDVVNLLWKYIARMRDHNIKLSPDESRTAHRILEQIKGLKMHERHASQYPDSRRKRSIQNDHETENGNGMSEYDHKRQIYRKWIESHDLVPSDKCIEHFIGVSRTTVGNYRKELIALGYEFENIHGENWKVIKRPIVIQTSIPDTQSDTITTLELLKKQNELLMEIIKQRTP